MSTFPMHLIDHVKPDLPYAILRTGLLASLASSVKKVCAPVERAVTIAVIVLVAAFVISVFMKLGASGTLNADYCTGCELASTLFVAPQ